MVPTDIADAYALLGITLEARDEDINKAFRQKSLKVHPDRNPNNPEAAAKFHELKQAQELLLDPQRRSELDASLKRQREHAERYAKSNAKRKEMLDALDERERATKKTKTMTAEERRKEQERVEELKEASRRMREDRERAVNPVHQTKQEEPLEVPTDVPVSIKYKLPQHPELTTSDSLLSLFSQFGPLDPNLITLKLKSPKNKPSAPAKFATAVMVFKKVEDAFGAVCASGSKERGLEGIEVGWVGEEPKFVTRLKEKGVLGGDVKMHDAENQGANGATKEKPKPFSASFFAKATALSTSFSSFPDLDENTPRTSTPTNASKAASATFESVTLMRLRQAQRDREARELLEKEAREEE